MSNALDFDFSSYNPEDPWNFPPDRLVHFAMEASALFKKSRNKWAPRKKYPDLRYVVFHELHSHAYTLSVLSMLLRDNAQDLNWWNSQPELHGKFDSTLVKAQNMNLRYQLQAGFFGNVHRQTEVTLRQILEQLDPEAPSEATSFNRVWKNLFYQCGIRKYEPLIQLMTVVRNSITHNGKFCPANRKNLKLQYKDLTYLFHNNQEIDVRPWGFIDNWDFVLFLLRELDQMLNELFLSPQVSMIGFIRTRYLS